MCCTVWCTVVCTVVKDQWRGVRCANSAHHHSVSSSGPQPLTTITIINRMGPLSSNTLYSDCIHCETLHSLVRHLWLVGESVRGHDGWAVGGAVGGSWGVALSPLLSHLMSPSLSLSLSLSNSHPCCSEARCGVLCRRQCWESSNPQSVSPHLSTGYRQTERERERRASHSPAGIFSVFISL